MTLSDIISVDAIAPVLRVQGKKAVLQKICEAAARDLGLAPDVVFDAVMERERLGSTGVGGGVAIPHALLPGLPAVRGWFARLETPMPYESVDDEPVDLVFLLLAPEHAGAEHLKALARVSRRLRREDVRRRLRDADTPAAAYALLADDHEAAA